MICFISEEYKTNFEQLSFLQTKSFDLHPGLSLKLFYFKIKPSFLLFLHTIPKNFRFSTKICKEVSYYTCIYHLDKIGAFKKQFFFIFLIVIFDLKKRKLNFGQMNKILQCRMIFESRSQNLLSKKKRILLSKLSSN